MIYYNISSKKTIEHLKSDECGLPKKEAEARLQKYGENEIKLKKTPLWKKIIEPLVDIFMLVLIFAGAVSIFHGDYLDAVIIYIIVAINAIISYVQSFSTERILKNLQKTSEQTVNVLRNKKITAVSKRFIVPGDIIHLSEGDKVPADGRIISENSLKIDESMLTGESLPIAKTSDVLSHDFLEAYQQENMLFQGAFVVSGNVDYVVTATGDHTEFGKLAKLSNTISSESLVQNKINKLVGKIIFATGIMAIFCFCLSLFRGMDMLESLKFVMSLSVSVVPEGLPIAISIILALGMRRMAKKNALVRNMRAIETVGVITTIATDKTGTLTENKLTLQDFFTFKNENNFIDILNRSKNPTDQTHDPLDRAIEDFIAFRGIQATNSDPIKNFGFNQDLSLSGNMFHYGERYMLSVKGAPEAIIENSKLDSVEKAKINEKLSEFTKDGYRVIALATIELDGEISAIENVKGVPYDFVGLIAVADILRKTSASAIKKAQKAGVSVRMITGDHQETAYHIGKKLGLSADHSQVLDTSSFRNMSDEEIENAVLKARVFARVTPETKYKIINILSKTEITTMTGDGVNDVPALAAANVAFAMGSGSEIAKDAGDIILLDDNFKSIITAMQEGRTVVANINKMIFYALATNAGEAMTMIGALILGIPLPLFPVQILWINLVTDSSLIIPLGLEPSTDDVMDQKPKSPNAPILSTLHIKRMILVSILMTVMALGTYIIYSAKLGQDAGRTLTFTLLVVVQWANAFNSRNIDKSIFSRKYHKFNGKFMIGLSIAFVLQVLAFTTPLGTMLHVHTVPLMDLAIVSSIAFVLPIVVIEIHKKFAK